MIKFICLIIFINFILFNKKIWFICYNLCFLIGGGFLLLYIFKDKLWNNLRVNFGSNYYSIFLISLRFWIVGLIFIRIIKNIKLGDKLKLNIFLILLLVLILFFITLDLLIFYFFFEVRMIPTFFLIIYWGRNPERVRAAFYLIIYILIVSFPLLVYIFNIYNYSRRIKFSLIILQIRGYPVSVWGYLIIYLAFYIKIPIYIFHIWLPKAHVEAPVYGSIILAGVLLKIGSYGIIRFFEILGNRIIKYRYIILRVRIVGSVLSGLICLVQVDIKRLVAYSSVVHINIILGRIVTIWKLGIIGAYLIILSHGLCSSGLFYIVNLYYDRTGSRLLILNKGILNKLPNLTFWWFLLCISNFSYPFSLNFLGELLILIVLVNWDLIILWYLIIICFIRRAYSLYLYSYLQYGGEDSTLSGKFYTGLIREYIILIIHIYPLILILLNIIIFI